MYPSKKIIISNNNYFYSFLIIIVCLSTYNCEIQTRIIGGQIVKNQTDFPFIVSLQYADTHICGGSILNSKYIITAAHCCYNDLNRILPIKLLSVVGGIIDLNDKRNFSAIRSVRRLIIHELYDDQKQTNDIALIQIFGFFQWNSRLRPITLAFSAARDEKCTVIGWGITKTNTLLVSRYLQRVEVDIVPSNICRFIYSPYFTKQMICAGGNGKDSCQGDSGGPLLCSGRLSGIVSWGNECGVEPGVYMDISAYKFWIWRNVGNGGKLRSFKYFTVVLTFLIILKC